MSANRVIEFLKAAGIDVPGRRDGSGPYKGSAMAGGKGRRQQAGETCPLDDKKKKEVRKVIEGYLKHSPKRT